MGKPAAPATPDYAGAAKAQGEANLAAARDSAVLSNPIMNTPYGSQTVDYLPDGRPVINQYLPPDAQEAVNQQNVAARNMSWLANQESQRLQQMFANPFSFGGQVQTSLPNAGAIAQGPSGGQFGMAQGGPAAPQLQTSLDESGVARAPINAGTTAQQAIMSRLEPALNRQRVSTETQLINQGLRPGGEAYNNAINLLGQQENDARQQAVLQGLGLDMSANQQGFGQALNRGQFGNAAQLAGFGAGMDATGLGNQAIAQNFGQAQAAQQGANQAQQQQFGQGLAGGQFGNTALQQALAQALQIRQEPINEITALMSGSQVANPQFPGYQGATVNPAPLFDATQADANFAMQRYQQQVAQRNAMLGGLFGLAAAPFSMFSFGGGSRGGVTQ